MDILVLPDMTDNRPPKPMTGMLYWAERTKRPGRRRHQCDVVLWKWHDGSTPRSLKPSPWRCSKKQGHGGVHRLSETTNQIKEFIVGDEELESSSGPTGGFLYCTHIADGNKKVGRGESANRRMWEACKFHGGGCVFAHCWAVDYQKRAETWVHSMMKRDGLWLHHELFTLCADPYVAKYLSLSGREKQSRQPDLVQAGLWRPQSL